VGASTDSNPRTVEVLLVEDSPYDAELILRALRKTGLSHDIVWLKDGVAALEQLFGPKADASLSCGLPAKLVLLDLKLPKVDGQEVLRRIKTDPRTRSMPVVVLTSSCEESDVLRAYDAGANSYIVKPVDFDRLTEVVRQVGLYWLTVNQPPARPVAVRDKAI
jgi:two-component system, response regulator